MYLLSFPRFCTLSIERFWFLFWYILNGVTLKTSNINMQIFWVYFTRVGDGWITGSMNLDYEQRVRYGQKIGMFASKKIEGHERKKIVWHHFFKEGWFPAPARHTKQGSGGQGQRWRSLDALGTGHYLSPGGTEDFRGDHWKLWKDSEGEPLKFAWKMKTWGREGITLAK